jgi:hypothetical protein
MAERFYLTIRDFVKHGVNFKTEVESWDFAFPREDSYSWRLESIIDKPLIVRRKKDKYSSKFVDLVWLRNLDTSIKFPEATLTIDRTGRTGWLLTRIIYDFSDLELIRYLTLGKEERIYFNFAKASMFEASVEKIQSP